MSKISIGKNLKNGKGIELDIKKLIDTRLLITANSGAGKSWLIRRILEQSNDKVQQIVLDMEGEFNTLREEYDYLLIGKGGDIPINIKTAEILARKILELNVSAIIDLYELKAHERHIFVKRFLDAMINAPKELWHSCLVIVDESHVFCPEKGNSEAMSSVIDLATRGRKRGFSAILATQRISKLHKDAAAECNNKLLGRASLDIDMKRAAEELGITSKEEMRSLRKLEAGEFFAFGPAISDEIVKVKIGDVKTTHPKAGSRQLTAPPPATEKVKKLLTKLIDLPKEAEEEIRTLEDYKRKIRELQHEIKKKPASNLPVTTKLVDGQSIDKSLTKARNEGRAEGLKALEEYRNVMDKEIKSAKAKFNENVQNYEKVSQARDKQLRNYSTALSQIRILIEKLPPLVLTERLKQIGVFDIKNYMPKVPTASHPMPIKRLTNTTSSSNEYITNAHSKYLTNTNSSSSAKLREGAMRMLKAIVTFGNITRERCKTLAGISNSTTFSTYIQELIRNGWVIENNRILSPTQEGIDSAGEIEELPTDTESLYRMWSGYFREGASRMLRICIDKYPEKITRDELMQEAEILNATTFSTYLQELKRNGLIEIEGVEITAAKELMEG